MGHLLSTRVLAALLVAAGSSSADPGAVVTAVQGEARASDRSVTEQSAVEQAEAFEIEQEGGCSILLDGNAVVELCGGTRLSFDNDAKRGVRIVNVDAGAIRMLVEAREPGERIEIHTPAAIATILGTVVYVAVDSATGASTFSSSESRVAIENRETPGQPGTTIEALEQLTVAPGEAHEKRTLSREQIDALGGCLLDFRDLALRDARSKQEVVAIDRMLEIDQAAFEGSFEQREVSPEEIAGEELAGEELAREGILDVTDTDEFRRAYSEPPMNPDPPDCDVHDPPIPGEHCDFGHPI